MAAKDMAKLFCRYPSLISLAVSMLSLIGWWGPGVMRLLCTLRFSNIRRGVPLVVTFCGLNIVSPWVPPKTSVPSGSRQETRSLNWKPPMPSASW